MNTNGKVIYERQESLQQYIARMDEQDRRARQDALSRNRTRRIAKAIALTAMAIIIIVVLLTTWR